MSTDALTALHDFADAHNAAIDDQWERSWVRADVDGLAMDALDTLTEFASIDRLAVDIFVGHVEDRVRLGPDEPQDDEKAAVARLLSDHEPGIAQAARSARDLIELVVEEVRSVELAVYHTCWTRTRAALEEACTADWWNVAMSLEDCDRIRAGDTVIATEKVDIGGDTLVRPASPDAHEPGQRKVADVLRSVSDAYAWVLVAVDSDRTSGRTRIALHRDQSEMIPVHPQNSAGGFELLQWLRSEGPNREEALRFELRRLTASQRDVLPDARAVRRLSEYRRMALSRDNAEAVHRAVADGHREAIRSLRSAATELSRQIEVSARNAIAVVVAVLGLVGLLAQTGFASWYLVGGAGLASVVALCVTTSAGLARIDDSREQLRVTRERIEGDRLLPEEDRDQVLELLEALDVDERASRTRNRAWLMTGLAILIVITASVVVVRTPSDTPQSSQQPGPTESASTPATDPSFPP